MLKSKNILTEITGVFTSNIASLIMGFATGIILSRVLGPELKGVYTALLVVPGIISSLIMLGSRPSAIFHIGKKLFTNQQVISAIFFLSLVSSLAGIMAFLCAYWLVLDNVYTIAVILLVVLYIPVKLITVHSGSIFLANQKFRKANLLKWLTALLTLITVFVFVYILKLSLTGAVLAMVLSAVIVFIIAIKMIGTDFGIKLHYDPKIISKIWSMGFIYALGIFIIQLNFRVDILLLNMLSTKHEIGIYSVGVSIAEKMWQLPAAIGVVLISRTASSTNLAEMAKDVGRLLRIAFLIMFVACLLLLFISPYIVPLVYGQAFARSGLIVQHILPGILFFVIVRIISSSLSGIGKPLIMVYIFIPTLILNIILNFLWIPGYGCLGAAWATNVSYIAGSLIILVVFARITKTSLWSIIRYERRDFQFLKNIKELRKAKKLNKELLDNTVDE